MQHTKLLCSTLCLLGSSLPAQLGLKIENLSTTTASTYVEVPYDKALVPQTGLTLEAWLTYDESTLGTGWRWPTVARMNPTGGMESYWLRIDAGTTNVRSLAFGYQTSSGLQRIGYAFAVGELKVWTHVAATFDAGVARLYVNGVLKSTGAMVGATLRDQGGVLRIGNGDGNVIENWNGELDEVRLWPFARTADEIQSTMNQSLSKVPGAVSTWNLDFIPADSSGNNHGADVNSPKYQINTLTLTGVATIGGASFGAGTAGCAGTPAAGVSGYAKAVGKGFALTCIHAGKGVGSVGFLWMGIARFQSPVTVAGANLWADATQPGLLLPFLGDSQGLLRIPAPIPVGTSTGTQVHCQFFFSEPGCNVPIFASDGLTVTVQN